VGTNRRQGEIKMRNVDSGGNEKTIWVALGASNHSEKIRERKGVYTDPIVRWVNTGE
jgi:hypothetical protein